MNLKQFLKPDWRKITLTIILFVFLFVLLPILPLGDNYCFLDIQCKIFSFGDCVTSMGICSSSLWTSHVNPCAYYEKMNPNSNISCGCNDNYTLPWNSISFCGKPDFLTSILIEIFNPLIFVFAIIASYLLSCLIVWIYDKLRKRK